jgi:hypothetical protein
VRCAGRTGSISRQKIANLMSGGDLTEKFESLAAPRKLRPEPVGYILPGLAPWVEGAGFSGGGR